MKAAIRHHYPEPKQQTVVKEQTTEVVVRYHYPTTEYFVR